MSHVTCAAGLTVGRSLSNAPVRLQGRGRRPSWPLAGLIAVGLFALAVAVLAGFDSGQGLHEAQPAISPRALSLPQPSPTPAAASGISQASKDRITSAYGKVPLSFVPNKGQTDRSVRYYAQGAGFGFFFTDNKAVLSFEGKAHGQALDLRFLGASANAALEPRRQGKGMVNYLKGDDPNKWQTGLPTYGQLAYQGLWPGIDMRFQGTAGKLEYEFALKPGASPEDIRLAYAGAEGLSLSQGGSLLINTPLGTLRDSKPRAYQRISGRKVRVQSRYSLNKGAGAANAYGFELGSYDRSRPLVIDPGLAYSTYLGGTGSDEGFGIAVDEAGSAYVTGDTVALDFPTTAGAFDTSYNANQDAFVTKLDSTGSTLAYSTVLGGGSSDAGTGIALDGAGNAYVTGSTFSSDFPTTPAAFATGSNGGYDAFVTKLDASGSALAYSTYLGGTGYDEGKGIAVDGAGRAYVTGYTNSGNFPTTAGAFAPAINGGYDAFVTKLDGAGSALVYSTFLGGMHFDQAKGIAVDGAGSAYVTGYVTGTGFPTTAGAFDTSYNAGFDAFVTKLDSGGSALAYSTYLGGSGDDQGFGIAVDGPGSAYVTGYTASGGVTGTPFPTTPGAFDTSYNGSGDSFVTKLDAAGSALAYSTYLGGTNTDQGSGITVDGLGSAYVAGYTNSPGGSVTDSPFPTTAGAFHATNAGFYDAFVTKLDIAGSALAYSTYLGGTGSDYGYAIAVDGAGDGAYVTGRTTSSDFPTAAAFDATYGGNGDAFVTKLETTSYPHPASAASIGVSLVPAFRKCGPTPPNSQHAPSLAVDSCNPPQPTAANARVGPTSIGDAHISVISGDVALSDQITDVVDAAGNDFDTTNPTSGCPSFTGICGDLGSVARIRFTDHSNCTPAPCSGPYTQQGTRVDLDFGPVPIDCSPQGSPTLPPGSTCSVTTTANTLVPGSIVAGKESTAQVFRVRILDNSTSAQTLFEQQGIDIP